MKRDRRKRPYGGQTPSVRVQVFNRDKWTCLYCGARVIRRNYRTNKRLRPTLDHVVPKSEGGAYLPTNLITCCYECNQRRDTTPVEEFAGAEAFERIREALGKSHSTGLWCECLAHEPLGGEVKKEGRSR